MKTGFLIAVSGIALGVSAIPDAAVAQEAGPPTSADAGEIVVTAQKRSERLRDVPQVASVLDGDTLSKQGLNQLQDIAARTPGLSVGAVTGVGRQQVTLRGITTGNDVSQTVGIYVDDVPYGSGTPTSGSAQLALELGSFDLQRIEVLRGPQGTLYGASAFGGVIKYNLNPPALDGISMRLQGEGSDTKGGGFNWGLRGAVDATLVPDKLGLRVTALNNHSAGTIDNIATGEKNVDASDVTAVRFSLLAKPADGLNLRGTILIQDIDRDGSSTADYTRATGQPTYGDLTQNRLIDEPFDQKMRLYSLGGDYDLGFADFTLAGGYQTVTSRLDQDGTTLYLPLLGGTLPLFGVNADAIGVYGTYDTRKYTLEARLASHKTNRFEWLVGAYYTDEDNALLQAVQAYEDGTRSSLDIGTFRIFQSVKEIAGFANATVWLTDKVDVTAGVRLARNDQDYYQIGSGLIGTSNPGSTAKDTVTTWLFAGRWRFSGDNMLYVRAASGYRPGGPNIVALDPVTGLPIGKTSYDPDTLWNYEAGVKLKPAPWLSLDASAFYIDWKGIQLYTRSNGLSVLANGKSARSKGVEASFSAEPLGGLAITGSAALIDAALTAASPELGAADGERLPNVPRFASNLSVDQRFDLGGHRASIGATWRYVGERRASFNASTGSPQYILPAFHSFDLRAGISFEAFELSAYVRNLSDKRGQTGVYSVLSGAGPSGVSVIHPRTFGLVATADF